MENINALYRISQAFLTLEDMHDAVQIATDEATKLTHAAFGAFFYNVANPQGESYMLYAISGVDKSLFSQFPMPRNTAVFAPTFSGTGAVRLDNVTKDPRYGKNAPHRGMPKGHLPVKSYLAVPVSARSGEVLGALFFGHPEPGIFTEASEKIAVAIAGQAASGIENARLIDRLRESEEQFKQLADSIPQLAWITNELGVSTWYNQRWYDYTGASFETMQGDGWKKVHHPDHLERVMRHLAECREKGATWEDTFPLRGKDGHYRWFLSRALPLRNQEGKITRWFGTNTDITDQRNDHHALTQSEERWRSLTEAMPQLVWICRGDGHCDYLNSQWEQYTGEPVQELLGFAWLKCLHPEDRERTEKAWRAAIADKAGYNIEYRIRRKDGAYRWFKTRGVAVRNEAGTIVTWYGTCTDIQELVDAKESAEAANTAKSEFLANISHEIRTPMNAVIGLANILAMSKPLTEKQQECLKTLRLSADALLELINDLLDIAKIEARTMELANVPFSLSALIEEVVSIASVKAQQKGLSFIGHGQPVANRIYIGDPMRLKQIIMNLCSNAVKFTERGRIEVSIQTKPAGQSGVETIIIAVKDTGIGIPEEIQDIIFNKFVQADYSINRKYEGAGLGLAITKTLVELMQGSIRIISAAGKGATFIVELPLELAQPGEAPEEKPDAPPAEATQPAVSRRPEVLLVEDYPPNIMVATTFLDHFGYDADVATNGLEALEKFKRKSYALVLMDVQMHGMNGLEGTRLIREYERAKQLAPTPIIGMTAHALTGDRERCLAAGMDNYIAKPFNPSELHEMLESTLALERVA